MIEITNITTGNWDNAIKGMRNPLNSWAKSDSYWTHIEDAETLETANFQFFIGDNDLDLCKRLIKAGSEHRKFLRQIFVSMDINAPLYWWKEMDQYKVGTTTNSCSTMHRIHSKEFTIDDFSHEHLFNGIETTEETDSEYFENPTTCLEYTISVLNNYRKKYIETKDKRYWWQLIQLLPSSYNQLRTWSCSLETVLSICKQRDNHKLDEWRKFRTICFNNIPYLEEFYNTMMEA